MLQSIIPIYSKILEATDGEIGRCKDFLFDDRFWVIRYMVADTRKWLPGRKVLISPVSIKNCKKTSDRLLVNLSKTQIKESPGIEKDLPVSRQYEIACSQYYGWPNYWHGPLAGGNIHDPADLLVKDTLQSNPTHNLDADSHHLRSTKEVNGYYIEANKESVGRICDFILDEKSWAIKYMVVQTGSWLSDKKILLSPMWARFIDWSSSKVSVDLSPVQIKKIPEYRDCVSITREYENLIFSSCSKKGYWETEKKKIAEEMIKEGQKRVSESQRLKEKGKKILIEKSSELKKFKTRIDEGKKITKEADKMIRNGENIVAESDFPQRNIGVRQVVVGKNLKKSGQKRIEHYKKKLETAKEWVETGETLIEEGKKTMRFGKTLKQSGRRLVDQPNLKTTEEEKKR